MIVRQGPSGPPVTNAAGGPLDPSTGAVLRTNRQIFPITGNNSDALTAAAYLLGMIAALPGVAVTAELLGCRPTLNYELRAEFDATNGNATTAGTMTVALQTSVDNVTWTERAFTSHTIGSGGGGVGARRVVCQSRLYAGEQLGIDDAHQHLYLRAVVKAPAGAALRVQSVETSGAVGSNIVQLTETF